MRERSMKIEEQLNVLEMLHYLIAGFVQADSTLCDQALRGPGTAFNGC